MLGEVKQVTTRKKAICVWCGETIHPGEKSHVWTWIEDGHPGTVRVHPECHEAWDGTIRDYDNIAVIEPYSYHRGSEIEKWTTLPKLDAANKVLAFFASDTKIEQRPGGWYIVWKDVAGAPIARRWSSERDSHYPPWYRIWGRGSTACQALWQLIRWLQGQTVYSIEAWKFWSSEASKLVPPEVPEYLLKHGWPERACCIFCGKTLTDSLDWGCRKGLEGPCCPLGKCPKNSGS